MNNPIQSLHAVPSSEFQEVRQRTIFECCKWDIQCDDHCVLSAIPLVLGQASWEFLAGAAEALTREALAAERELAHRPDLLRQLGFSWRVRRALTRAEDDDQNAVRVMRFDFHWTTDGWKISEVNADVPGGFIEASGFTRIMAEHYPNFDCPPDPAAIYASAISELVEAGSHICLLHATTYSDDHQVMRYLSAYLRDFKCTFAGPTQLEWTSGWAKQKDAEHNFHALIRFFPAEWLPSLGWRASWEQFFSARKTLMSNPASAILLQGKRFPLAWQELSSDLSTWKRFMPFTEHPSTRTDEESWVWKPILGRVGSDIGIAGVTPWREFAAIKRAAKKNPRGWVCQRRFEPVPIETEAGPRYPCIGVFTVNGRAAGIYGRIARKPLINEYAQDAAVLLTRQEAA